jgi:hypothetical protein
MWPKTGLYLKEYKEKLKRMHRKYDETESEWGAYGRGL